MMNETQTTEVQDVETQDVPFEVPEGFKLLSDAEMEQLAAELVESRQEKWEVQEIVDAAVAAGELNALMRNEFIYEFKQGGRTIRGLTAAMIAHLATAQGASEITEERVHVEDDEKHEFTVVVEMPSPVNPSEKIKRTGFSEADKIVNNRYDKFAKQKAYTKAFRNACMKLLPQDLVISTIYRLAKLVPSDWTPRQALPPQRQAALPAPNGNGNGTQAETPRDTARKAMYARFTERKAELEKQGITEEMLREGILKKFSVDSRADLTEAQYVEVRKDLTGKFADWVLDLAPKTDESEAEADTDKEGDQQPF